MHTGTLEAPGTTPGKSRTWSGSHRNSRSSRDTAWESTETGGTGRIYDCISYKPSRCGRDPAQRLKFAVLCLWCSRALCSQVVLFAMPRRAARSQSLPVMSPLPSRTGRRWRSSAVAAGSDTPSSNSDAASSSPGPAARSRAWSPPACSAAVPPWRTEETPASTQPKSNSGAAEDVMRCSRARYFARYVSVSDCASVTNDDVNIAAVVSPDDDAADQAERSQATQSSKAASAARPDEAARAASSLRGGDSTAEGAEVSGSLEEEIYNSCLDGCQSKAGRIGNRGR